MAFGIDAPSKAPKKSKYPKGSYFTQAKGDRAGQKFTVKTGKSGLSIRKYASGETAVASTDSGVDIAKQKRDVAARGNPKAKKTTAGSPGGWGRS